jgi:hypothetical protein
MNAKKFSITTINGTVEFDVAGRYFKLLSTVNPVDVELLRDGVGALLASGVEGGFYQKGTFTKIRITHTAAEAVSFLVAPDEGGSDRFTGTFSLDAAAVDALQFADDVTKSGEAFMGCASVAAVGAQYAQAQLRNPAGSGKILYLDRIDCQTGTAVEFSIHKVTADIGAASTNVANLDHGGAAPSGEINSRTDASLFGSPLGIRSATDVTTFTFNPPWRIGESEDVGVSARVVNVGANFTFYWREKTT